MPARTLNDFFAGFFYPPTQKTTGLPVGLHGEIKADMEVKTVIAYKGQENGEERLINDTTKKTGEISCFKTEPFKASKIL